MRTSGAYRKFYVATYYVSHSLCVFIKPVSADIRFWVCSGEWTLATTDCAKGINGRFTGAAYDGTFPPNSTVFGSCVGVSGFASTFNSTYKTFLRQFWEAQTSAYEASAGWVFWTWKTAPGAGEEWSYSIGLEEGWIPQNVTERLYPDICG